MAAPTGSLSGVWRKRVAGLIAVAVANEVVIAHPHGHTSLKLGLLLAGGPLLFIAAQGWHLWAVPNVRSALHLLGGIALLAVGGVALFVPAYFALIVMSVTLVTLAAFDLQSSRHD